MKNSNAVAFFGECMLELHGCAFGTMQQAYGGDTFNTALYLRRCSDPARLRVHYATAVGDDALSAGLRTRWAAHGLELDLVQTVPGRLPGIYQIAVDAHGERCFSFWREHSAARAYFDVPLTALEARADAWSAFYFSGISLAILPPQGRQRLLLLAQALRTGGAHVVFDNNYRPRLWGSAADARRAFEQAYAVASVALVTADDHQSVCALATLDDAIRAAMDLPCPEIIIKCGAAPTRLRWALPGDAAQPAHSDWHSVPTQAVARVVDTTAAGDSFAAGYLSRRLLGADALSAAAFGNRLAARVIQHPGAIIAETAMADLMHQ